MAIDGKTLRRSHDRRGMKNALHLVCAWSVENHLVLGQTAVDDKSNEITAIPELLKLLEFGQRRIANGLVTQGSCDCQLAKAIRERISHRTVFNAVLAPLIVAAVHGLTS